MAINLGNGKYISAENVAASIDDGTIAPQKLTDPGTDGVYAVNESNGNRTWVKLATVATTNNYLDLDNLPGSGGSGSSSWFAGTSAGMTSVGTEWADLATLPLPAGWLTDGAALQWRANILHGDNNNVADISFDVQLRRADDSFLVNVHAGDLWAAPTPGTGVVLEGYIMIPSVASGNIFFSSSESKDNVTRSGVSQGYFELGTLTGATKLVLVGTASSSTLSVNVISFAGLEVTPA